MSAEPQLQVQLSRIEGTCLLRNARHCRDKLWQDIMALQERKDRGGHNGAIEAAIRALDNELYILDTAIRKLWAVLAPTNHH